MLSLYQNITHRSEKRIEKFLNNRLARGKEDPDRYEEKKGIPSLERPEGKLLWMHAASVGEAQSVLILINTLLETNPDLHILVSTGTRTSAQLLAKKLPARAFHQFYPMDYPDWCERFLDHWKPDMAIWVEKELWPNMLLAIKKRGIPAVLVNGQLSKKSAFLWRLVRKSAAKMLCVFDIIFCQSEADQKAFEALGARRCVVADNLKYAAAPLPYNAKELQLLQAVCAGRPIWLYASTHAGEEELAARVHGMLQARFPELLTIIVPRHPERREEIAEMLADTNLNIQLRGDDKQRPDTDTQIYIADTLGELGLFYRLSPIALIGRSFSKDGGGGHNPIEAAQLLCAVLYGPKVQNLQLIFDDMESHMAALQVKDEQRLIDSLSELLSDQRHCQEMQKLAKNYASDKAQGLGQVLDGLQPLLNEIGLTAHV